MSRKFYRYCKAANRLVDESNQKDFNPIAQKKHLFSDGKALTLNFFSARVLLFNTYFALYKPYGKKTLFFVLKLLKLL